MAKFVYDDNIHRVEYEGLHTICFHCGIFSHQQDDCPKKVSAQKDAENTSQTDSDKSS